MRDEREAAAVPDPRLTDQQHPEHTDHEHYEGHDHTAGPRHNGGDPDDNARVSPVDTATAEERAARVDDGARSGDELPATETDRAGTDRAEAERAEAELPATDEARAEHERAEAERADAKERVDEERVRPDDLGDGELSDQELPPTGEPVDAREPDAVPVRTGDADAVPTPTPAPDAAPEQGLWNTSDVESLRERWREIQLHFVDDPGAAARGAAALVDEAARSLVSAVESRRAALAGPTTDDSQPETERLRLALQRYRDFLDRVLQV